MTRNFILTLTGPDRIGIVESVTGPLLELGGNVETSRMVRLGGEFAILMLVTLPQDRSAELDAALGGLAAEGYKITTTSGMRGDAQRHVGWVPFRIEVEGADHEGIIHEVSRYLADRGINIESMESETSLAPVSGSPLFSMTAEVLIPPKVRETEWENGLVAIADRLNLEVRVSSRSSA